MLEEATSLDESASLDEASLLEKAALLEEKTLLEELILLEDGATEVGSTTGTIVVEKVAAGQKHEHAEDRLSAGSPPEVHALV